MHKYRKAYLLLPAGTDTTSGALLAALQNPALGLLSPEQQDLFSRLHRQLSSQRRRQADRAGGEDDADTGTCTLTLNLTLTLPMTISLTLTLTDTSCCSARHRNQYAALLQPTTHHSYTAGAMPIYLHLIFTAVKCRKTLALCRMLRAGLRLCRLLHINTARDVKQAQKSRLEKNLTARQTTGRMVRRVP